MERDRTGTDKHWRGGDLSVIPGAPWLWTAPATLLIMSDLDSLLVELESSIERRVTRLTVETESEERLSTTRQHPRSEW